MSLPSIAVINFSPDLTDQDVQEAIRAVNRKVTEDFIPIWGGGRTLRLHAADFDPMDPDALDEEQVQADSVMYLVDEATLPGALGYHDLNTSDMPLGFVFVLNPDDWTVTLSHEVLELIMDPTVNIFVPGPDPRDPNNLVLHTYEICDAVERTSYKIDEIDVSNFLTPNYFTIGEAPGTRNDFLGVGVTSFGVTQNSHIAFFNLSTGQFEVVFGQQAPPSSAAARRAELCDHAKPERPGDEILQGILGSYKKKLHSKVAKLPRKWLPNLPAITRTGRYQEASQRIGSGIRPLTKA